MALVIISYDIVDDRRRNKVAKALLDYGKRVQYSVFEVEDTGNMDEIVKILTAFMNKNEDNIRYYRLCAGCEKRKKTTGKEKEITDTDKDYIII